MKRRLLTQATLAVAGLLASTVAMVGPGAAAQAANTSSAMGGPVILTGIDAEDCGPGGHGPIQNYVQMVQSLLDDTSNGGNGILVLGAQAGQGSRAWWDAIGAGTGEAITYGAASTGFGGYQMIGVTSADGQTCGGLTQAESDTLANRQQDFANFVNSGGGLLANTQQGLSNPFAFAGGLGNFVSANASYSNIDPTAAGTAVGVTDALDVCCWHNVFTSFPSFLEPLAYEAGSTMAAAIGGSNVVLGLQTTKTAANPGPVATGSANGYTITITNPNDDPATVTSFTDTLPPGFTYTPGSTTGATTADPTITSSPSGDALVWSGSFALPALGTASLTFGVTVSSVPGTYTNTAGGTAQGAAVASTGATAPVVVESITSGGPKCPGLEADPRAHIVGTAGTDTLKGTSAAEVICGLSGNDRITAGGGDDLVVAGDGVDYVDGGPGNDVLLGGKDNDQLLGGKGVDTVSGEAGNDLLDGGPLADVVNGGPQMDKCIVQAGIDTVSLCP